MKIKHGHLALSVSGALLCAVVLTACPTLAPQAVVPEQPVKPVPAPAANPALADSPVMVGGDRDAHGCIPSAGYLWCSRDNVCAHPWEVNRQHNLAPSTKSFDDYCGNAAVKNP